MWKESIVAQDTTHELESKLYVIHVAGLQIHAKKKRRRKNWDELYVMDKFGAMFGAVKKGQIEISKSGLLAFLREYMPDISEDYYLKMYKCTLGEQLQTYVNAAEADGYEIGVPPKNPKHPVTVSCTIDTDGQEGVSEAQAKALDYIEDNDEALCKLILEALHAAYREAEQEGYFIDDFKAGASSSDDLRTLCKCHGIHITQEYHNGMAYAEYAFQLAWLGEDQWQNVVLHGDRLIHVGGSGEGWEDPEA